MTATRQLPELVGAPDLFWDSAKKQQLAYQKCRACESVVFYPRGHCPDCGASGLELLTSAGFGQIYTATVMRSHYDPYVITKLPCVVALIDLDEGFRMLCEVAGSPDDIALGSRVRLEWDTEQEIPIPTFVLDEST